MATPRQRERKAAVIAWAGAWLIRLLGRTLRFRIDDQTDLLKVPQPGHNEPRQIVVWVSWHNRILCLPYLRGTVFASRRGAVLTSRSNDGEIIARLVQRFGVHAVRGSSSKGAAAAIRQMVREIRAGFDMVITPDGPRGPRYCFQSGALKVAQITDAAIAPIRIHYHKAWELKTWDGFLIPKPFSRVEVTLGPLVPCPSKARGEDFEQERQRIETLLQPDH